MARRSSGRPRFLAVAGNMGSGKSTFVDFLRRKYDLAAYFEPNEANPYLKDFYADMRRWAFQSQVYFLAKKLALHQQLRSSSRAVVQDRTIYEDAEIFAENLYRQRKMHRRDYRTYRELYESIVRDLEPPDLMIYLRCSVRTLRRRIRLRGRPEERGLPRSYLERLQQLYESWLDRYDRSPVLVVDTEELDYLENLFDRADLFRRIDSVLA